MRARRPDHGFTLTEMMVVVVIVGLLSAVATPFFGRDRLAREGRDFASSIARDLQKARVQAITDRLAIRAFIYRDRIEFRSAVPGATPGAPPRAATTADPVMRVLRGREELTIADAVPLPNAGAAPAPDAQVLTTAAPVVVEFNSLGQAQLVGGGAFTGVTLYVRNNGLQVSHPERFHRIDVTALTGFVSLQPRWN
jgi:prepilin-type N-terminal cleavage/methylation domain-containing protein